MRADQQESRRIRRRKHRSIGILVLFLWSSTSWAEPAITFDRDSCALNIPFKIRNAVTVLTATVNDSTKLDLIFDTGVGGQAVVVTDPAIGRRLGLSYAGQADIGGAGNEGSKVVNIASGVRVAFPGVTFSDLQFWVHEKPDSHFINMGVDGFIGGALTRCVVEMDCDQSKINFYDPAVYKPSPNATEFPITFSFGIPVVDGVTSIESGRTIPLKLLVDTGVGASLLLFEYSDPQIRPVGKTIEVPGQGISGEAIYRCGRIASLQIGTFLLDKPIAFFVDEKAFGDAVVLGQNGMIGNDILERFKVTFDYAKNRIFLEKAESYTRPFEGDMTGLLLEPMRDGRYKVIKVYPDSPATGKDIQPGDVLVAVDERDVREIEFREMRKIFDREGANVTITLERGSEQLNHTLTLERQI